MTEPTPPANPFTVPPGGSAPADPAPAPAGSATAPAVAAPTGYETASGYGSAPATQQWGQAPAPYGWAPVQPVEHVVPTYALASPGARLGAALLNVVLIFVTLGIGYLVWALVLWGQGTNPGKKICGLRVVKSDTGRLCTFGDMLLRNFVFGYLVMGLAGLFTLYIATIVDYLMICGERRQRLVDKMAGTLVVKV